MAVSASAGDDAGAGVVADRSGADEGQGEGEGESEGEGEGEGEGAGTDTGECESAGEGEAAARGDEATAVTWCPSRVPPKTKAPGCFTTIAKNTV